MFIYRVPVRKYDQTWLIVYKHVRNTPIGKLKLKDRFIMISILYLKTDKQQFYHIKFQLSGKLRIYDIHIPSFELFYLVL